MRARCSFSLFRKKTTTAAQCLAGCSVLLSALLALCSLYTLLTRAWVGGGGYESLRTGLLRLCACGGGGLYVELVLCLCVCVRERETRGQRKRRTGQEAEACGRAGGRWDNANEASHTSSCSIAATGYRKAIGLGTAIFVLFRHHNAVTLSVATPFSARAACLQHDGVDVYALAAVASRAKLLFGKWGWCSSAAARWQRASEPWEEEQETDMDNPMLCLLSTAY